MLMKLVREPSSATATIGRLSVGGMHRCYTCEDVARPGEAKITGRTAIPEGRYRVIVTHSERFGVALPLLVGVPGFTGIRIHPGNTADDTEGCILPGEGYAVDRVTNSRTAFARLFAAIRAALDAGEEVWIEISQRQVRTPMR